MYTHTKGEQRRARTKGVSMMGKSSWETTKGKGSMKNREENCKKT